VNTGTVIHHTQFLVPAGAELGAADITVVANGIASDPVHVTVSSHKKIEVKELKIEVKEFKELKEIDVGAAAPSAATSGTDPDLLAVVRMWPNVRRRRKMKPRKRSNRSSRNKNDQKSARLQSAQRFQRRIQSRSNRKSGKRRAKMAPARGLHLRIRRRAGRR
jgi:hypothetical protein